MKGKYSTSRSVADAQSPMEAYGADSRPENDCPDSESSQRSLDRSRAPRSAETTRPALMAASVGVMMSLVQMLRMLGPDIGPGLRPPGPATLGTDSHRRCPFRSRSSTQHRSWSSWNRRRAKKPDTIAAATITPPTAAGRMVIRGLAAAVRLRAEASSMKKVAGRKTTVTSDSDEKLATRDSRPTGASSPPRAPGLRILEAMRTTRYGEAYTIARESAPTIPVPGGPSDPRNRKRPRPVAGTRPSAAPTLAARAPRVRSLLTGSQD